MTGGWTVPQETPEMFDTELLQKYNGWAEGSGSNATPVALLATQVVAGTNYAFLCKEEAGADAARWVVNTIYVDLEGKASLLSSCPIDLANVATIPASGQQGAPIAGGWQAQASGKPPMLEESAENAFESAAADYKDVALVPVALLGTQVVSGVNYLVLCTGTPDGVDTAPSLYVVKVYQDAGGTAQITSAEPLDLSHYIEY